MARRQLRVTGGEARGTPLAEPRGVRLRPTTGLVREALFNILGEKVRGARVLDLFAGTGALGIEALSRGAASAVFVERDRETCQTILRNLAAAGYAERGTVIRGRLPEALQWIEGPFDIVLLDPPYGAPEGGETLAAVSRLLAPGGVVVYEHASRYNPPGRPTGLVLVDERTYGDTTLSFYMQQEAA
ncbi:MAG: 16S rRNA (guanine(966)-N(2))-methyltransferase RsmD [Chloroflexota bacterium]|nr:16S rRNA (guanine(966)-N(2))-methyltransferase RsmD [Dehalococcoidia bacterium]MDW8046769.1 16S rRNA (guanine(966)-N(2))-methyltransferase RsmD [Chloroflexota bacterium]